MGQRQEGEEERERRERGEVREREIGFGARLFFRISIFLAVRVTTTTLYGKEAHGGREGGRGRGDAALRTCVSHDLAWNDRRAPKRIPAPRQKKNAAKTQ